MKKLSNVLIVMSLLSGLAIAGLFFWFQMRELGFFASEEEAVERNKTATIMVYMIGSNLESDGGCATADIEEMCRATLGENVKVVIQTGGSDKWEYPKIATEKVQRFSVENGELKLIQSLGLQSMVESETLADFLSWGARKFPADRYGVILWNHGGGTALGFGEDEYFPDDSLTLDRFAEAFKESEIHVDFIGFDACLMATVEMAYLLEPYADYLIASEEIEPGSGWYYTDWLTMLGQDTMVSTETLGKKVIDDYVNSSDSAFWEDKTLALIDLKKIPEVHKQLGEYLVSAKNTLETQGYKATALVRNDTKDYGAGGFDQIDIRDYVELSGIEDGDTLLQALEAAVVYRDGNVADSCGLAMYYPYVYPDYYEEMDDVLEDVGFLTEQYENYFEAFLDEMEQGREKETIPEEAFVIEEKGEGHALKLTPQQWENIIYIERQMYVDDGTSLILLGNDTEYEFDGDGDLKVEKDATWLALNGQIVPYYIEDEGEHEDGSWYRSGYIPAEVSRKGKDAPEYVEIVVYWDEEHPEGYVVGYRGAYEDDGMNLPARNMLQFEEGDTIEFMYGYYQYSGTFAMGFHRGGTMKYGEDGLVVSREQIGEYPTYVSYYLKDIYQNEYQTGYVEN